MQSITQSVCVCVCTWRNIVSAAAQNIISSTECQAETMFQLDLYYV